jgi:hypothetical protein
MATTPVKLRARDTDRVETCSLLDTAHAEGQLTDAEHATRTDRAMKAVTFEQLGKLVDDLQIPSLYARSAVVRPDRRPRDKQPGVARRWASAAGIVVVAAGIGALAGSCSDGSVGGSASPSIPTLTTGEGIAHFIDDYRATFGDTVADEVLLFPEQGSIDRKSDSDPTRYVGYTYDGEFDSFSSDSARPRDTRTLDLGAVDVPVIAQLVSGAPQSVRVPDGTVSQVRFEYGTNDRIAEPVVTIYVQDEYDRSAFMTATFDGDILGVYFPSD